MEYHLNFWKITVGYLRVQFWGLYYFLYINALPNISKILNFYLFADDYHDDYHESNSLNDLEKGHETHDI